MKINIEIECDTVHELGTHLNVILDAIAKKAKRLKLDIYKDEFLTADFLNDDNCYGSHTVKLIEE